MRAHCAWACVRRESALCMGLACDMSAHAGMLCMACDMRAHACPLAVLASLVPTSAFRVCRGVRRSKQGLSGARARRGTPPLLSVCVRGKPRESGKEWARPRYPNRAWGLPASGGSGRGSCGLAGCVPTRLREVRGRSCVDSWSLFPRGAKQFSRRVTSGGCIGEKYTGTPRTRRGRCRQYGAQDLDPSSASGVDKGRIRADEADHLGSVGKVGKERI